MSAGARRTWRRGASSAGHTSGPSRPCRPRSRPPTRSSAPRERPTHSSARCETAPPPAPPSAFAEAVTDFEE
eukprot:1903933-Lingulodinium_polyedra.AAC.1